MPRQTLQVGRFNRLAQKLFSMKGDAVLTDLVPELGLTLAVFHGGEDRYLEGWDTFSTSIIGSPQAGQNTCMRIRNPKGSNVVAIFSRICFNNTQPVADIPTLQQQATTADLSVIAPIGNSLDNRGRANPTCIFSRNDAVSAAVALTVKATISQASGLPAEFVLHENQEWPLLPGDALQLQSANAAQGGAAFFFWKERVLEDSERA